MLKLFDIPETPINTKNEWYTPSQYIEAAREVMGSIDLDPASCELANRTVKATLYYTKEDNGLILPWYGNVWLNPPWTKEHGKSTCEQWALRLVKSYEEEEIKQAIFLGASQTSSAWFALLWNYLLCFPYKNISFFCPQLQMTRKSNRDCSVFVYLGFHTQKFIDVFSRIGTIAKRVN